MTLLEGRRAITQTVSDQRVKARGPGCPRVNLPAQQPFRFDVSRTPPPKGLQYQRDSDGMTPNGLPEVEATTGGGEIRDRDHPGFLPLHQIEVLRVMGVRCPWHPSCHPSLTVLIGLDTLDVVGDIGRKLV